MTTSLIGTIEKKAYEHFVEGIIQKLRYEPPVAYGDNDNLLIDFGWDISSGDGLVAKHIEVEIKNALWGLTEAETESLWLYSICRHVRSLSVCLERVAEYREDGDEEDVLGIIFDAVFDSVRDIAESKYMEFSHSGSIEDEEDEAEW